LSARYFSGSDGGVAAAELEAQEPGAGGGTSVDLRGAEAPLLSGLESDPGKVAAGAGLVESSVRDVALAIDGDLDPYRNSAANGAVGMGVVFRHDAVDDFAPGLSLTGGAGRGWGRNRRR